jgi:acetyl esterase/lipase
VGRKRLKRRNIVVAERLREAGVQVDFVKLPNTLHHTAIAMPELNHTHLIRAVKKFLYFGKMASL